MLHNYLECVRFINSKYTCLTWLPPCTYVLVGRHRRDLGHAEKHTAKQHPLVYTLWTASQSCESCLGRRIIGVEGREQAIELDPSQIATWPRNRDKSSSYGLQNDFSHTPMVV